MDNPKAAFEARKAKADAELQAKLDKKRQEIVHQRKMLALRFEARKGNASTDHLLSALETPGVKHLSQINNRPAELLGRNRTKGMVKKKGNGPSP